MAMTTNTIGLYCGYNKKDSQQSVDDVIFQPVSIGFYYN